MVSQKIVVWNKLGIHLRPATLLSKKASDFESKISLKNRNTSVNVKSVLGLLGAGVSQHDEIEIICEGPDEEEALSEIINLIRSGLGDDE
ncbi:MAG: HPr family phosphocarrier protein [Clostridiales bacterium]|nr:HPr family phosphocarrier protein [Clostridiales bacterium]